MSTITSVETYEPSLEFVIGPWTAEGLANALVEHTRALDDDEAAHLWPTADDAIADIERFIELLVEGANRTAAAKQQLPAHLIVN